MPGPAVIHTIFGPVTTAPAAPPAQPLPDPLPVDRSVLDDLVAGRHPQPRDVLGPHPHEGAVTVRVYKPLAKSVVVRTAAGATAELSHEHDGVWAGVLPGGEVPDYRLLVTYDGHEVELDDPYRFSRSVGDLDLHLVGEGRHERLWDALGAHVRTHPVGETGTSFAVWAPHALGVRLKGDFNSWDGREHPMSNVGNGVWELFVPGVGAGTSYKFVVLGQDGTWRE
ncbi:MAG: 1,4-alpha-glucan branching enzyme, partial [Nocardioides sp.]|nr:1,4-alpha-glucan branching enzyme [Nocardioides sp.]